MIHLDTSFLIVALVRGSRQDRKLREWLRAGESLGMSTIAWAGFLCGPVEGRHVELAARVVPQRLPFEEQDAAFAARLFNQSGRRRGSLVDCMIAATALRHEAHLATNNPSDFRRLEATGLTVIPT
jgi:predicted nucleic acid-binding protein